MEIKTEITGLPDFSYLIKEVKNPDSTIRGFASYRRSQFAQNIAKGVDPYGNTYAPLTAAYLARKTKKYGQRPIMVANRKMVNSYKQLNTSNGFIETIDSPGGFHQSGTRKMARRMLLPENNLPEADQEKLIELALKNLRL